MIFYKNKIYLGEVMEQKNLDRKGALNFSAICLFAGAAVLSVITIIMSSKIGEGGWAEFMAKLDEMLLFIRSLPNKWLILIAIMLVYVLKNFIPIPFPFIFIMSGVIFDSYKAVIINVIGFSTVLLTKYYWGRKFGGGTAIKQLQKYDNVREMMYRPGNAKLGVLVALRLIPSIPVNMVSKIYGGMKFPVIRFLIASVIGFLPKIWTYSVMGGNVSQPFTWHFMGPIVGLFILSGTVTVIVNIILEKTKGNKKNVESI